MQFHKLAPLAVLTVLALAACEKKAETPTASASEEAVPAATALPPSAAASDEATPTEIPPALRGRWGLAPLDCTGDPAAAKGLITVDAASIKFYESVAKLGKVKDGDADEIEATFAFTGEGQTWTLDVNLELDNDGKTLKRKDTGKDAMPGTLEYTRCG